MNALVEGIKNVFQFGRPRKPVIGEGMDLPGSAYNLTVFNSFLMMATGGGETDEVLRRAGINRVGLRPLMFDDEISQAMEQRFDTLLARGWTLTGKGTPSDSTTNEKDSADVGHELKKVFTDLVAGLHNAIGFGYSVVEIVYRSPHEKEPGDTLKFGLKNAVEIPFEFFDFKDGELWHRYPAWAPTDPRKFLHAVRKPSYRNPRGEALLSRLYWVWFFRTHGWQFWMKYLERCGVPFLVGKTQAADKIQAAQALYNAVQNAVIAIGPDDDVEALDFGRNPEIFTKFEEAIVRRIQKLILGQTLTSGIDGGSGNKALGEVHEKVTERKVDGDINMIRRPIQRVVDILCAMNNIERLEFNFNPSKQVNGEQAVRDVALKAAGIVVAFKPEYLQRSYGLRVSDFIAGDENTLPAGSTSGTGLNNSPKNAGDKQPSKDAGNKQPVK